MKRHSGISFIVLAITAAALMFFDQHSTKLQAVRGYVSVVLLPIEYVAALPQKLVQGASEVFVSRRYLTQENNRLEKLNFDLQAKLQKFYELEAENANLRKLLHALPRQQQRVLVAEIIRVGADPFRKQIVINKGKEDNVTLGQPVIDAFGVVGQVINVGAKTSMVLLITDTGHAVPVRNNRNGVRAIVQGNSLKSQLELLYVPDASDFANGDLLVTSGLGGRFPSGYPVGIVKKIEHQPGSQFAFIRAVPSAELGKNRQVLLVWPKDEKSS